MNVCLIFSGIAKLLCKCMVTIDVNLSKIWSKNCLYDHFNQRLHIQQTSQCYFTQVLIFHCPVSITMTFFSKFIECVSWYWVGGSEKKQNFTRSLGISGGPSLVPQDDVKRYHLQFGWTKCTICERFEPRSHFNSRLQSFIVQVNVVLNALHRKISRHVLMFVVSQASTWLWHMRDLIYIVTWRYVQKCTHWQKWLKWQLIAKIAKL